MANNIEKALKRLKLSQESLPEELKDAITGYNEQAKKYNDEYKAYSKKPDEYDDDRIQALRDAESSLDLLETELISQLEQFRESEDQRIKDEEAQKLADEAEAAKLKAEEEQRQADEAEAAKLKAEEEQRQADEAERLKAEQEKSSGSVGKGVFVGAVLLVLTLGAVNLFRNK
jgi:hypothetical protein